MKNNLVFDVSNMKCAGCVSAVKMALNEMGETEVIEVSLEEHQAVVKSSKTAKEIADVITAAGFPAEPK
jgi:copper chaperone CopZ